MCVAPGVSSRAPVRPTGEETRDMANKREGLGDGQSEKHDREHRSGYGGKGGAPDTSSEKR